MRVGHRRTILAGMGGETEPTRRTDNSTGQNVRRPTLFWTVDQTVPAELYEAGLDSASPAPPVADSGLLGDPGPAAFLYLIAVR
jgi:hypothetical protein